MPGEATPTADAVAGHCAVVGDLDLEPVLAVAQQGTHLCWPGVLERVREALLHHAERRQLERRGQRAPLPLDHELRAESRLAHARDEPVELGQRGLRLS